MSQDRLPQASGLTQGRLASGWSLLGRGALALRRLSERMAFPGDSLALLALLLLANLLRIHFPGGVADAVFVAVALLMGLSLLRGRVQAGAWPVLLCFAALLTLYGIGLLFAFSLQGVRHWMAILLAGLVFLFCHQNGPALVRSRGVMPVLALALALLFPVYVTNTSINAHTLAALLGYLLLTIGLVLVARGEDARRQHWWAHLFFLFFVANGVVFGHRALVGGLLLAYPLYWGGRYLLRSRRGAGLLAGLVAAIVWLMVAVLIKPLPTGAASYIDSIFQDYTGGKAETGRQTLWGAALAGMAETPWLGKGPGAVITVLRGPRREEPDTVFVADGGPQLGAGASVQEQGAESSRVVAAPSPRHACLNEANPGLAADCNILIGLRNTHWADVEGLWSWDYPYPIASWRGVTLGGAPPRVTELDLSWLTSLSGEIPSEIAQLDQLIALSLFVNAFSGGIPREFGRLVNLQTLSLAFNDLSGPIPKELGSLKNLRHLFLDGNRLTGVIPAELTELPLLKLTLAGNEFEGPIPDFWGVQEHDLDRVWLCLPGVVGAELLRDCTILLAARSTLDPGGKLNWGPATPIMSWQGMSVGGFPSRVQRLRLHNAGLGGSLPRELGALDGLVEMEIRRNGMTGPIPPQFGRLTNLRHLVLDNNALTGPVPPQLTHLRQLRQLLLSNNRLTGVVPAALGTMPHLEKLTLGGNRFAGALPPTLRNVPAHDLDDELFCLPPAGLPASRFSPGLFRDCTILLSVRRSLVGTHGLNWRPQQPLGKWQGVVLGGEPLRVVALDLDSEDLSGRIPAELGGLDQLVVLNLANNRLAGPVPAELARLGELVALSLENNRLVGGLPPELIVLPKLEALSYMERGFDGPTPLPPQDGDQAPDSFCRPSSAHGAGLFADCTLLLEVRDLLAGAADLNWRRGAPIGAWQGVVLGGAPLRVVGLNLEGAGLRGRIPAQLADLGGLETLRLADNALKGSVPAALGGIANLGEIRLGAGRHTWDVDALRKGLFCLPLPRVGRGLLKDCETLLAARDVLDADGQLNWSRMTPMGEWDGVNIDGVPLRVLGLILGRRSLRGKLPVELAALEQLRTLNLNRNELEGSIPPEWGGLRRLRELKLVDNALTGAIPPELGELPVLSLLLLRGNAFTDVAPAALREVANHDLDHDRYCLPSAGAGSALVRDCTLLLNMRDTLAGVVGLNWRTSVPIGLWEGVQLGGAPLRVRELNLTGKGLLGQLPPELGGLTGLQALILEGNVLSGRIPPQLGDLANLRELRLRGNRLSGRIPQRLGDLGQLSLLRLGGNNFSGPIPEALRQVVDNDFNQPRCPLVPSSNFGLLDDCANLLAVRDELAGSATLNWSEAAPMSAWHGVVLGGEPQRVTSLGLAGKKPLLDGRIPAALGRLDGLASLYLGGHRLQGPIPAELGNLGNLKQLYMEVNSLTGPIPAELGNLKNLEHLYLNHNSLTGLIPAELGGLEQITHLSLCGNFLTGAIPAEFGDLENLEQLELCHNSLTGTVPTQLGDLENLQSLRLHHNQLSGVVPAALGSLPELRLDGNAFSGSMPPSSRMEENWDPAAADQGLVSASLLAYLSVDGEDGMELCDPTSSPPPPSGLLKDCSILLEARDLLADGIALNWSPSTPVSLWRGVALDGEPPRVIALDLAHMGLRGVIPAQLGGLDELISLRLGRNALTGPIPAALGNLAKLRQMMLSGNALTGVIPAELGSLDKLRHLRLAGNRLTGDVPEALAARLVLPTARLDSKATEEVADEQTNSPPEALQDGLVCSGLDGQAAGLREDCATLLAVKDELAGSADLNWSEALPINAWRGVWAGGEPVRIRALNLPAAGLNGRVPAQLAKLDRLASLQLSGNQLTGEIPAQLGGLGNLKLLRLSNNRLTGAIPPELGDLAELRKLALDGNELTGGIPMALTKLAELEELRLANNELGGPVPSALALLDNLVLLRLGGNDFIGCLPPTLKGVGDADLECVPSRWGKPPLLEDAAILMAVRDILAGDADLNWSYSEPIASWRGVVVAGAPPRVVAVNLSGAGLSGRIPAELGALDRLSWLRLNDNRITGAMPPELGWLTDLRELALQGNALTGAIPLELQHLVNLEELRLGRNQLSGAIPPELGRIDSLWVLKLLGNNFTGCLPSSLLRFGSNLQYSLDLPVCGEEAKGAEAGIGAAIQALNKLVDPAEREGVAKSTHNLYLQFGLQTGILGLSLLTLLCASLIFGARSRTGGEVTPVQRFVATCVVMVIIQNVFEVYLLQNLLSVGICSWILIGLGIGELSRNRREEPA